MCGGVTRFFHRFSASPAYYANMPAATAAVAQWSFFSDLRMLVLVADSVHMVVLIYWVTLLLFWSLILWSCCEHLLVFHGLNILLILGFVFSFVFIVVAAVNIHGIVAVLETSL